MKQNLNDILILQKRELEETIQKRYIQRQQKLIELNKDIIKVIIGPRRAGKSFFTMNELKHIHKFGYVNFDDEQLIGLDNYNDLIESINSIYNDPKVIFLDEIQNLNRWKLFINRLQRQGYNIIISGSNSNLLSNELSTHLTGRYIQTLIFPFSFKEYLSFYNKESISSEKKTKLSHYLEKGGFPEPLVKELNYKEYLRTLLDSIIFKDIVKRYNLRHPHYPEELFNYCISNFNNLISFNKLLKLTGLKSIHTIEKYLKYFEETFILFRLNEFSYKIKEQIKSKKKIYTYDNGLILAKAFQTSFNIGKKYENMVAIELKKQELNGNFNLYYYKTNQNYEIDFLIYRKSKVEQLIQVCFNIDNEDTKAREIRALLHASKELDCNNLLIITAEYNGLEKFDWFNRKGEVQFIPLWKWLLEET